MEKLKMHTPDLTTQNIEKIAALFPNCVTEAHGEDGVIALEIDFDQLRQELSRTIVEGPRERYVLDWPGKNRSILKANERTSSALRPSRDDSINFDVTRNVFIEGENLEALKLLQETYLNTVDLIYIDPPYNTGSDLLYNDYFVEDQGQYRLETGQEDEKGNRLVANPESIGRFHSVWLSMLYPRLRLAKSLMKETAVILISIDDHEISNAIKLCDLVFGASNFIATLVWEKGRKNDAKLFSVGHEYVLVYARSILALKAARTIWREEKPGAREIWEKFVELRERFGEDYKTIEIGMQKWFSDLPKTHPSKKWSRYKRVDKNGPWRDRDISWPGGGGPRYDVPHPKTGLPCKVPERGWIYSTPEEMQRQIKLGLVEFRDDHSEPPFRKAHIRPVPEELEEEAMPEDEEEGGEEEYATQVRGSYFYKQSQVAVKYLRKLMGAKAFDNPKDHLELARLFNYVTGGMQDALIVDFFAGSASSAHAVMHLNRQDGGTRRYIVVQFPEALDPEKKEQKAAAKYCDSIGKPRNIAEIAKERIRRAQEEIKQQPGPDLHHIDLGFRVFKVDTSNMRDVYYTPDQVQQTDLLGHVDNIRDHRGPDDLLFQVLLDWGVDLASPISTEIMDGRQVYFVDGNALAACFEAGVTDELVKRIAERKPLRAVFRDASYSSDSVKINVEQIFKFYSPDTEVRAI